MVCYGCNWKKNEEGVSITCPARLSSFRGNERIPILLLFPQLKSGSSTVKDPTF